LDANEVVDDGKVADIGREQRDIVDVGGRCDRKVDRAAARLSTSLRDGASQAAPFSGYRRVDRERIECRFDHAESLGASCAFVWVCRDQQPEVKLSQRRGTDCPLKLTGILRADEH